MENKKTLQINCAACDVRKVTEEVLSAYDEIKINAASLITSPEAQVLLGKYNAKINCATTTNIAGNVVFSATNGSMSIKPGQVLPEEKMLLMVNGPLDIAEGSEDVLKNYAGMMVNGPVTCPESLTTLLSAFTINGPIRTYPDGAVILKNTTELDRLFHLRAKQDTLYYASKKIVALASDINFAKLTEKNVRFVTKKLLVSEANAEAAVPLFDEKTDIMVLPDGCAYVDGDAVLDASLVKRYGGKLYIGGDLSVTPDSASVLDQVSYLRMTGDLLVYRSLKDRVLELDVEYEDLYELGGVLIRERAGLEITAALLEGAADGLSVMDCANVTIDSDVTAELLREKLVGIANCASVVCANREQVNIVQALGRNVAAFTLSYELDEEDETEEESDDGNTVKINAAFYTL